MHRFESQPMPEQKGSFQDQLITVWRELHPDILEATIEERAELGASVEVREDYIKDKEVLDIAGEYGIDVRNVKELENGLFEIPVENHFGDERLPEGYGYKGGAARALLLRNLEIDPYYTPRDVDVIRMVEKEVYEGTDADLAQEYMPEDFAHGYGVEEILDQDEYFATRDLTINEALATDEKIIATRQCILDNIRHIIRLSDYERDNGYDDTSYKMLAKILRFYAESIHRYDEASIEDVADWEFEEQFISPFWLALQLDRAFDVSSDVAAEFTSKLKQTGQIPEDIGSPEEAAIYLGDLLTGDPFYYRHAPIEQFELEQKWIDDDYDYLPKKMGHGRSRQI